MEIGDANRKFVYLDPKSIGIMDKCVSWVLLEVTFSRGLPTELDMMWGSIQYK